MGRPRIYDWPDRFKRNQFTLKQGKDYVHPTETVIQQVRCYASNRGMRIRVDRNPRGDRFTVHVLVRKG